MYCGVHLAMQFQRTLVRTGLSILDRFAVKLIANKFRFLILSPSGSASRSDGGGHTINKQQQHGNGAAAADSSTSSNNNNNNKGGDGKGAGYITNEYQIFSRSASHLLRLAQFLLLAIKQFRREEKNVGSSGGDKKDVNLPLVVAALNETSDTFLVIGLPPASKKLRKK